VGHPLEAALCEQPVAPPWNRWSYGLELGGLLLCLLNCPEGVILAKPIDNRSF